MRGDQTTSTPPRVIRLWPYALSLLGGVLVAAGLPPLGWWPTMFIGIVCYFVAAEHVTRTARAQFTIATLFAWGWLAPAMGWMWHLVPGGFVIAPLLFSVWHGLAAVLAVRIAPIGNSTPLPRLVVRATLHALVECIRVVAPFGGVPLAGLALGLADTRLAYPVRLVGPLGLAFWVLVVCAALASLWLQRRDHGTATRRPAFMLLAFASVVQALALVTPHGRDTGNHLRVAAVQGGGPQGVLAIYSNPRDVTLRHLQATQLLDARDDVDLVVWPENVIDVDNFATSTVREEIAAEAKRLDTTFAVGVTEDAGNNFTNAQIVVDRDGVELSRYDKVRRVPYGEYVPLRSMLESLGAPVDRIPRDAVAGTSRAIIDVPLGSGTVPLAVAISWEVFFSRRVDDGVSFGGEIVVNPTNGSSYTGEILQQQQVATSRLRAIESGRYVVQAATTGYSLFVDPDGRVLQQIPVGKQAVILQDVPLRTGRTPYSYLNDTYVVLALLALLALTTRWLRR